MHSLIILPSYRKIFMSVCFRKIEMEFQLFPLIFIQLNSVNNLIIFASSAFLLFLSSQSSVVSLWSVNPIFLFKSEFDSFSSQPRLHAFFLQMLTCQSSWNYHHRSSGTYICRALRWREESFWRDFSPS